MKIALIQCPVWGTYDPPVALAQLSACLKKAGHNVFIFDINIHLYFNRKENYKNMWAWEQCDFWYNPKCVEKFFSDNQEIINQSLKGILEKDAKAVCFSVSSASRIASLELAKRLKEKRKDLIIIFGGTLFFDRKWVEKILEENCVNIAIPGEGEVTLCELVNLMEERGNLNLAYGIVYKKEEELVNTGERPLIENLDILPYLDFSDLSLNNYDDSRHIALMTSRGCVMRCVFCSSRKFWPGFRTMGGERIFQEVKFHKEKYKDLGHVNFLDLVFNGNMKELNVFCDLIIKEKFNPSINWTANAIVRPEMTNEVLRKMKEANCKHLIYGIESGSQSILDKMKKRYRISDADNVIRATHEAGIGVTANFMFGFPGEKEGDFKMTLDFIKRNAEFLDRVYPSRTFCAIEEFSYFHSHLDEFGIKPNPPNHLYWESIDGTNTYPERLRRCEEFCSLAASLGIEVGSGVQTSVELDRWYNLGHFFECKKDYENAIDCYLKYYELDKGNEVVSNKIKFFYKELTTGNLKVGINPALLKRLENCM